MIIIWGGARFMTDIVPALKLEIKRLREQNRKLKQQLKAMETIKEKMFDFDLPSNLRWGTTNHSAKLIKDSIPYKGYYNGLSYWGEIYNANQELVEKLNTEWEEDEDGGYNPNFSEKWFEYYGYTLIK